MEKVYLRSMAVDPEAKMPRRAAIITGKVQAGAAANAYVVFQGAEAAEAALAHNMQLVRLLLGLGLQELRHLCVANTAPACKGAS